MRIAGAQTQKQQIYYENNAFPLWTTPLHRNFDLHKVFQQLFNITIARCVEPVHVAAWHNKHLH